MRHLRLAAGIAQLRQAFLQVPQDLRDAWDNLMFYLGRRDAAVLRPVECELSGLLPVPWTAS